MKRYLCLVGLNCLVLFGVMYSFFAEKQVAYELNYRFMLIYPQVWKEQNYEMPDMFELERANIKCVSFGSTSDDEQIEALRKAVLANVDGIITVGTGNSRELADLVNEAEKEGIPVVLVDSDLRDTNRSGYVGADNCRAGQLAARDMVEATDGQANVGIIVSRLDNTSQADRVAGFERVLKEQENMKILEVLECEEDRTKIRRLIGNMLQEHPELDAIYCTESVSSDMAGEILQELRCGPEQVKVVCSDLSDHIWEYIQEGRYYSAVVQNIYEQIEEAVVCLKEYINNGVNAPDLVYTGITSVKKGFDYESWRATGLDGEAWKSE